MATCQKWPRGTSATGRGSEPSRATVVRTSTTLVGAEERNATAVVTDVAAAESADDRPGRPPSAETSQSAPSPPEDLGRRVVDQRARIRRPSRVQMIDLVSRHLKRGAAGQQSNPHLLPAVHRRDERDHLAVGRDRRRLVDPHFIGQPLEFDVAAGCRMRSGSRRRWRRREIVVRIADVAEASPHVLVQTSLEEASKIRQARRAAAPCQFGSRSRTATTVSEHVGTAERTRAGQHLEHDAAERPDVGPLVHRLTARLFRTHVGHGAEHPSDACVRECGRRDRVAIRLPRSRTTPAWDGSSRRRSRALSPCHSTSVRHSRASDRDGRCHARAPHRAPRRSVAPSSMSRRPAAYGLGPRHHQRSASVPPSTSSSTSARTPWLSSMPWIVAMPG